MSWFHWKQWVATEFAGSQAIGLSRVGLMLGHYQKYMPKPSNIAELKTASVPRYRYGMICHRSSLFIDKAISSFRKRLRSCVAAAGGHFKHSLNTDRAAEIRRWNVGTVDEKVVQSPCSLLLNIQDARLHVYLKKLTLKFKLVYLLNHVCYCNKICRIYGLNHHL